MERIFLLPEISIDITKQIRYPAQIHRSTRHKNSSITMILPSIIVTEIVLLFLPLLLPILSLFIFFIALYFLSPLSPESRLKSKKCKGYFCFIQPKLYGGSIFAFERPLNLRFSSVLKPLTAFSYPPKPEVSHC